RALQIWRGAPHDERRAHVAATERVREHVVEVARARDHRPIRLEHHPIFICTIRRTGELHDRLPVAHVDTSGERPHGGMCRAPTPAHIAPRGNRRDLRGDLRRVISVGSYSSGVQCHSNALTTLSMRRPLAANDEASDPTWLGDYLVLRRLGAGGMGVV